jgi:hypothetical protein
MELFTSSTYNLIKPEWHFCVRGVSLDTETERVNTGFIIRQILSALKIETVFFSETSVLSMSPHDIAIQKNSIDILWNKSQNKCM